MERAKPNTQKANCQNYSRNERGEYLFKKTDGKYYVYAVKEKKEFCVSEAIYLEMVRSIWREEKQAERNAERTLSLDYGYETECDDEVFTMADFLEQSIYSNPESEIISNITLDEIITVIQEHCSDEELEMFQALFIAQMTEQKYATENGLARTTVQYRKKKLQIKLQKILISFVN